ncbi:hypothetical protein [Archangium violaceum]|uniref:hypothetical protein n=1 Tax=Archangium violaceum TaxID=83451 RepID=UPI0036DE0BC1
MVTRYQGSYLAGTRLFPRGLAHALVVLLLFGCGTASRAVRLDTGEREVPVFTPRGGESPVQLRTEELKAALAELARDVRPAAHPLQHARWLLAGSVWHENVYLMWTGRRLELDSEGAAAQGVARECLS